MERYLPESSRVVSHCVQLASRTTVGVKEELELGGWSREREDEVVGRTRWVGGVSDGEAESRR